MSRNIILYGPPGTGKTYKAKEIAVKLLEDYEKKGKKDEVIVTDIKEIINPKELDEKENKIDVRRTDIIDKFKTNLNTSIKLISFHQSFSYEDFVIGKTIGKDGEVIDKDGVLKAFVGDNSNKRSSDELIFFKKEYDRIMKRLGEISDVTNNIFSPKEKYNEIAVGIKDNLPYFVTKYEIEKEIEGKNIEVVFHGKKKGDITEKIIFTNDNINGRLDEIRSFLETDNNYIDSEFFYIKEGSTLNASIKSSLFINKFNSREDLENFSDFEDYISSKTTKIEENKIVLLNALFPFREKEKEEKYIVFYILNGKLNTEFISKPIINNNQLKFKDTEEKLPYYPIIQEIDTSTETNPHPDKIYRIGNNAEVDDNCEQYFLYDLTATKGNLNLIKYINDLIKIKKDKNVKDKIETPSDILNDSKVLIIDEINRGNISAIFGEIITLLEDKYREGEDEEIEITLSSGETFTLPNNLYIIGTMNTADRSAEKMDSAMRRRFEFFEVAPNAELVEKEVDGVNLPEIFTKINERIKILIGKEYCIGHSYFMNIKDVNKLNDVMYNQIIPLLEEYFYNDIKKIGYVLSKAFLKKLEIDNNLIKDQSEIDIEDLYEINYGLSNDEFIKAMNDIIVQN